MSGGLGGQFLQRRSFHDAQRLHMAHEHFARMGQRYRPFTHHKNGGQRFFQRLDALRNGATGDAEHIGRAIKASLLDHHGKRFQLVAIQHRLLSLRPLLALSVTFGRTCVGVVYAATVSCASPVCL